MATLKPAFDKSSGQGTLTAGNSSTLTDGASAVLLASEEWAKERGLPVRAYLSFVETAAVDFVGKGGAEKEGLLLAPAYAVPRMLARAGLTLQDFDFYEIHEAFAAQVLATLKVWEDEDFCRDRLGLDRPLGSIDRSKLKRQRQLAGSRSSLCGNGRSDCRHTGQNVGGKRQRSWPDLNLCGWRSGCYCHSRALNAASITALIRKRGCGPVFCARLLGCSVLTFTKGFTATQFVGHYRGVGAGCAAVAVGLVLHRRAGLGDTANFRIDVATDWLILLGTGLWSLLGQLTKPLFSGDSSGAVAQLASSSVVAAIHSRPERRCMVVLPFAPVSTVLLSYGG